MKQRTTLLSVVPILALLLSLMPPPAWRLVHAADTGEDREFGVMDNSDDMRRIPVEQVASLMKEIGYKSVVVSTELPQFAARVKAYRDASLRIGGLAIAWTTDGKTDSFDIPLDLVLRELRDTGAVIMFGAMVKDGATVTDERIVEQLRARAKQAEKAGVTLSIYPHKGIRISRFDHAARIVDAVAHPGLGVSFVLCHYMKQSDEKDLPASLRAAKDHIVSVVINGSPTGNTQAMSFARLVQHIDQGEFDLAGFLDLLCGELKFKGPIFFQCINLQAPTRCTLEANYTKWQDLKRHCRVTRRTDKED